MHRTDIETNYRGSPAQNYERYFVPAIGAPLAADLLAAAGLRRGERVLDVACGTGVVARRAAPLVGAEGAVAGLDANPAMLAAAREHTPRGTKIDWYESAAEAIPLSDGSFDVVLCQMGLQFFTEKLQALKEMRRVLVPGGRMLLNVPGPVPALFAAFNEAATRHIGAQCAAFVNLVFSLHDGEPLRAWASDAGFADIELDRARKSLRLPPPENFLWQYVHSTPLAPMVANAGEAQRAALAEELLTRWQVFEQDGGMAIEVGVTTLRATWSREEARR